MSKKRSAIIKARITFEIVMPSNDLAAVSAHGQAINALGEQIRGMAGVSALNISTTLTTGVREVGEAIRESNAPLAAPPMADAGPIPDGLRRADQGDAA